MTDFANLRPVARAVTILIVGCIAVAVWAVCVRLTAIEPASPPPLAPAADSPPLRVESAATLDNNERENQP